MDRSNALSRRAESNGGSIGSRSTAQRVRHPDDRATSYSYDCHGFISLLLRFSRCLETSLGIPRSRNGPMPDGVCLILVFTDEVDIQWGPSDPLRNRQLDTVMGLPRSWRVKSQGFLFMCTPPWGRWLRSIPVISRLHQGSLTWGLMIRCATSSILHCQIIA